MSKAGFDNYQLAFQRCFRNDLYGVVDALPFGRRVIDVPCGDGFYTQHLASRLGSSDLLIAVDSSQEALDCTRAAVAGPNVEIHKANAYQLPFADENFDLLWCAQSLISLDPLSAVREMFRVTKRDGVAVILEVDEYHHVLLPWPGELEAALPWAIQQESVARYGDGVKLAPARRLRGILKKAGFRDVRKTTYAFERQAPFDESTKDFLTRHFKHLRSLAYAHLTASQQESFDRLTDPDASQSLFSRADAELTCINAVYLGRRSETHNASVHQG
jgi:ubiquinone/menaquinone biosynthesis C-methylase UbiE